MERWITSVAPERAKVTSSSHAVVVGVAVTFTAPASGPSGTFASPCTGRTCVVSTNGSGIATTPTFKANGVAGGFTVTASAPGATTAAGFQLFNTMSFTISGNAPQPYVPGRSQSLNLLVTNPNPSPMTIAAGGISISINTGSAACLPFGTPANFTFTSLGSSVVVPANTTTPVSLTSLGVAANNLPVLKMNNTSVNQDGCKNLTLTLTYTGLGSGS